MTKLLEQLDEDAQEYHDSMVVLVELVALVPMLYHAVHLLSSEYGLFF